MKLLRYIPVLAVGLLFVACSDDDLAVTKTVTNPVVVAADSVPMHITAAVNGEQGITRATGTTWEVGDTIGISCSEGDLSNGMPELGYYVNEAYARKTFNVNGVQVDSFVCVDDQNDTVKTIVRVYNPVTHRYENQEQTIIYKSNNVIYYNNDPTMDTHEYIAYYPYFAGRESMLDAYNASTRNQNKQRSFDFMFTKDPSVNNKAELTLAFDHVMSMISFDFISIDGLGVNIDSLQLAGLSLTGTFRLQTGGMPIGMAVANEISDVTSRALTKIDWYKPNKPQADSVRVSLIYFPQSGFTPAADSYNLEFYNNGIHYFGKVNIPRLEAGKNYIYKVTLDRTAIDVSSATISPWINSSSSGSLTVK